MDERDGVVGLLVVAVLAWLLPSMVRAWGARQPPAAVITARLDAAAPDGVRLHWACSSSVHDPRDGWVLDASGSPLGPLPGWRGLLLGYPLDLNTATAADLEALPGIGPRTAAAVLAARAMAGPFRTVAELTRVRGIGPKTLQRLRPWVQTLPTEGRVLRAQDGQEQPLPTEGRVLRAQDGQEQPLAKEGRVLRAQDGQEQPLATEGRVPLPTEGRVSRAQEAQERPRAQDGQEQPGAAR